MAYAYAAVTSLMVTIERHLLQPHPTLLQHTKQMESLYKKLGYLQEFLTGSEKESGRGEAIATRGLEAKIRDVALEAEDIIELYLVNESPSHGLLRKLFHHPNSIDSLEIKFRWSLQKVMKRLNAIDRGLMKMKSRRSRGMIMREVERRNSLPKGSSNSKPRARKPSRQSSKFSVMIGHDYELGMVKNQLTRHSSKKLEILSIFGMGGLGKTTFCSSVYDDPVIMSHFDDKRAWITVSQEYTIGEILLGLLRCIVALTHDEIKRQNQGELAERLYKSLKGNRYLIVLDDVWTTKAWDDLKRYFPDDENGSRIMLTTRLKEVATYASSSKPPHQLRFLNADESWNLFNERVFSWEDFPPEFVKIGKDVAKKCQGLPLAIVVVASLLSKLDRRLDEWEKVAGTINSLLKLDVDQQCAGILSLSYNHLPYFLKACFLYFAVFPEDSEIPVKKLIRLWSAEGFLKVDGDKTGEEVAEECLVDLVDRSLVLVRKQSLSGEIKTCKVHDLLFAFCLTKSRNENFAFVQSEHSNAGFPFQPSQKVHRRISLQARTSDNVDDLYFDPNTLKVARSILFFDGGFLLFMFRKLEHSHLKLLRVLDLPVDRLIALPRAIVGLVNLRYLAFTTGHKFPLPITISKLHNLQTLHIRTPPREYVSLPNTIWNMPQLRHLLVRCYLSDPLQSAEIDGKEQRVALENLQTFSGLRPLSCTKEVLQQIPNIKKLEIFCTQDDYNCCRARKNWFDNLACLNRVETLSFVVEGDAFRPKLSSFPSSIKKLTLSNTFLPWKDMDTIGMLPNLEVLKAKDKAFQGPEWEPAEQGFRRLKFLLLGETNLRHWKATADHFPCLEHLTLRSCNRLLKIPNAFVDIDTLQLIVLHECRDTAVASAQQIQQKRLEEYGDDGLDVHVYRGPPLNHSIHLAWESLDTETPIEKADSFLSPVIEANVGFQTEKGQEADSFLSFACFSLL
ncbi:PREDICTED: putative late blight resistance protein homolog R1B-8 isoform X2 [Ipomoea nil]|uniref:putative late blight resistance protein homolog R1B-8 isoform X2 n=1 Tax=Ipomoea nil TaxID=35883 RepID=UPI0009015660|nr:PREDICTED: putative late blight resistance protein homolog R1B-8 isoform X2 [Ipomoea nil]